MVPIRMPPELRVAHWDDWLCGLLDKEGAPRKPSCFAAAKLAGLHPEIHATMQDEQSRVLEVEDRRRAARMAEATASLLRVGLPTLRAYAQRKQELGYLDYADLIGRTTELLTDPGAAWVLYKLDGGIDHLLLDEVQDTAPEQWRIAHRLTEEFFAGLGAQKDEALGRTFFAVGDPKQSIYSFQGADVDEFVRSRAEVAYRVEGSAQAWRSVTLDVSFRSTVPVLALVDAVFGDEAAAAGVVGAAGLHHFPDRAGDAGRVELWPLAPLPAVPELPPWSVPTSNLGLESAPQALANALATWIAAEIGRGTLLPSRDRALTAGDVLVLVRRRTDFARNLVRALKAKGVPVAGLDRLELTEQLAVQDLLAACDAVLLPQDDLQVACALTSPLGGLSDESLMALALGRRGSLWEALRERAGEQDDWADAWRFLSALAARADHVTPHGLLTEALGPLGGRARLLARLGPEAAEPIDELLNAALDYARLHAPSLQGFVHWLRRSGATVKREAGGAGGAVRVMTVHGAKGLQAPLVVLADTTALPPDDEKFAWVLDEGSGAEVPLWTPRREFRCTPVNRARALDAERRMQEYNRLLYVALTRAEDRLVVCGWDTRRGVPDNSWYSLVARGFASIGATAEELALGWQGETLALECGQTRPAKPDRAVTRGAASALPGWAGRPGHWRPAPPPAEPAVPRPLAPSRPEGARLGPVPQVRSPLSQARRMQSFRRGTLVHELLQHLPALPPEHWERAAQTYLSRHRLEPADALALREQALGVLRHKELAPLFGPAGRPEQPITGLVAGVVVSGRVDRMAVLPDAVLLAEYKTGRDAPADVTDTPVLYLRQLAAYRAVMGALYPDRTVRCALVWTAGPAVVAVPSSLLDAHAPGA
jgi:ATP-dependent helicase/nuclease subunit A